MTFSSSKQTNETNRSRLNFDLSSMNHISVSDWVLILTTVFLGLVALLTPTLGGSIKQWWLKPRLRIEYFPYPPGSHITRLDVRLSVSQIEKHRACYLRFVITNDGRTQARRCEAVLEELWHQNSRGGFQKLSSFGPIGLTWGSGYKDFIEINPSRRFFCDFISIPDIDAQATLNALGHYVDLPNNKDIPCGVVLCTKAAFYSQPNRLPTRKYQLKVAVFSENAPPVRVTFAVDWSGRWSNDEAQMMNECRIQMFSSL